MYAHEESGILLENQVSAPIKSKPGRNVEELDDLVQYSYINLKLRLADFKYSCSKFGSPLAILHIFQNFLQQYYYSRSDLSCDPSLTYLKREM